MCHDRDIDGGNSCYCLRHIRPAFKFNRLGTGLLDQSAGIASGISQIDLIGHEGHIGNNQCLMRGTHNRSGMVNHFFNSDRQRVLIPGKN